MNQNDCQIYCLETIPIGNPELVPMSIRRRAGLVISNNLPKEIKQPLRKHLRKLNQWRSKRSNPSPPTLEVIQHETVSFFPGDLVRVRSLDEIKSTLDNHGNLKGCKFMPEMTKFCGTTQQVFKRLERFLNECDYTIRHCNGMVLLKDVMCEGVAESGRCDRSCFFYWRVEWLEKKIV